MTRKVESRIADEMREFRIALFGNEKENRIGLCERVRNIERFIAVVTSLPAKVLGVILLIVTMANGIISISKALSPAKANAQVLQSK